MRSAALLTVVFTMTAFSLAAEVTMEKTPYGGWDNCIKLSNGDMELVVTTDVGPRVIRCGYVGGQNFFKEFEAMMGKTGGDEWMVFGGHRLWHAPEASPRTYAPDNETVEYEWNGGTLRLTQPTEASTGIQKQVEITLDPKTNKVTLLHRLVNRNMWDVKLAPWGLSVMNQGGRCIIPQEPYISHPEKLLPARPMTLWGYTDMNDPRWTWGTKYIQLQQDAKATEPQKIGVRNSLGWAAYLLNGEVFVKKFDNDPDAEYVDYGCNFETFTNSDMLEVESVGPLTMLAADGGAVEHVERWYLFKADVGKTEDAIDSALLPLVSSAK